MIIDTYKKQIQVEASKYSLSDPEPDDWTSSSQDEAEEEEEVDAYDRRVQNVLKFMYLFQPPLTPLLTREELAAQGVCACAPTLV